MLSSIYGGIQLYDKKLYEIAYALKEEDQGINSMNELCTKILIYF